jgi:hypothetical protein
MIQLVFSKAISERIVVDPYSDGFYQVCQLYKLKIPAINVFPASVNPGNFGLRFQKICLEDEAVLKEAEEKICVLSTRGLKEHDSKSKIELKGLPISLYQNRDSGKYRTKIKVKALGESYKTHFKRKTRFLLWYLTMCHKQLISLQNSKGRNVLPNAIDEFRKCFYEVLFAKSMNQLPIFVEVSYEDFINKDLEFRPVQIYLINEYLGQNKAYSKFNQVSLALICYWYQTFHFNFFYEKSKNIGKI